MAGRKGAIMNYTEHDPLCTAMNKSLISPNICSPCQLIRRVREDEQERRAKKFGAWHDYLPEMP